jgi:hypothetical protein
VGHEEGEQIELPSRERKLDAVAQHTVPDDVDRQVAVDHLRLPTRSRDGAGRASEHGLHAQHQLPRAERPRDVVVGTDLQAQDPVVVVAAGGQHDDRQAEVLGSEPGPASAGVTGPAFYVDGVLYRTVGTPTHRSGTGAPAHAWDLSYNLGGAQPNIATAAPGDRDYTGGRWQVHAITFPDTYAAALASGDTNNNGTLDSGTELTFALAAGTAVDTGVVKQFECPVIPLTRNAR